MKFESNSQYYEKNAFNEDDINIFFGSYEINLSNSVKIVPHAIDYYALQICTKGSYDVYVNKRKYRIEEGTLWVLPPYAQVTKKEFISDSTCTVYIMLKGASLKQYFEAIGLNDKNVLFPYKVSEKHATLVEEIIKLLSTYTIVTYGSGTDPESLKHFRNSKNAIARRMRRRGLFLVLLSELLELCENNSEKSTPHSSREEYIYKATSYIEANYSADISIDEIAKHLGLNRSYLYKLFKRELGISVQDFIIQTRIRVACSLLKNMELSIKSVALSINYDPITFSRIFKKQLGVTPTQYRQMNSGIKE